MKSSHNQKLKEVAKTINKDIEIYMQQAIQNLSEVVDDNEEEDVTKTGNEDGLAVVKEGFEDAHEGREDEYYTPVHTEMSLFRKYLQHPIFIDDICYIFWLIYLPSRLFLLDLCVPSPITAPRRAILPRIEYTGSYDEDDKGANKIEFEKPWLINALFFESCVFC